MKYSIVSMPSLSVHGITKCKYELFACMKEEKSKGKIEEIKARLCTAIARRKGCFMCVKYRSETVIKNSAYRCTLDDNSRGEST